MQGVVCVENCKNMVYHMYSSIEGDEEMNVITVVVVYMIIGAIVGLVCSLLFFRMDQGWKKVLTFLLGTTSSGGLFIALNNLCDVESGNLKNFLLAIMLISVVVSAFGTFVKLCSLLKNQDGANVIRVLDIILGQKDFIEKYYETRRREIDAKLNLDEINQKNQQLESKETGLRAYEEELNQRQKNIENQIKQGVFINLPERQRIPITNRLLNDFPEYVEFYAKYISHIRIHTQDFVERLEKSDNNEEKHLLLDAFFLGICTFTIVDLFQENGTNKIRVHFRKLDDQEEYVKLVATTGITASEKDLTPIPIAKANMINQSYRNRASMIKSLNIQYHFETANEQVWNEYLTYTFGDLFYNSHPFLSFGISVKNKARFESMFYFLNFCKIEYILQESIDKIATTCDIINIISENSH